MVYKPTFTIWGAPSCNTRLNCDIVPNQSRPSSIQHHQVSSVTPVRDIVGLAIGEQKMVSLHLKWVARQICNMVVVVDDDDDNDGDGDDAVDDDDDGDNDDDDHHHHDGDDDGYYFAILSMFHYSYNTEKYINHICMPQYIPCIPGGAVEVANGYIATTMVSETPTNWIWGPY